MEPSSYTYAFVGNTTTPKHLFATSEYTLTFEVQMQHQRVSAWVRPNAPERDSGAAFAEFTFGDLQLFAHAADNAAMAFDCVFPGEEFTPPAGCEQMLLAFSPPGHDTPGGGTVCFGARAWHRGADCAGVAVEGWKLSLLDTGESLEMVLADQMPAWLHASTVGLAGLPGGEAAFRDATRTGLTSFEYVTAPDPAASESQEAIFAGHAFRVTLTKDPAAGLVTIRLENRLRDTKAEAALSLQELFVLAATPVEHPRYLATAGGQVGIALLPAGQAGQKHPLMAFTDDTWRPEPTQPCGLAVSFPTIADFVGFGQ